MLNSMVKIDTNYDVSVLKLIQKIETEYLDGLMLELDKQKERMAEEMSLDVRGDYERHLLSASVEHAKTENKVKDLDDGIEKLLEKIKSENLERIGKVNKTELYAKQQLKESIYEKSLLENKLYSIGKQLSSHNFYLSRFVKNHFFRENNAIDRASTSF